MKSDHQQLENSTLLLKVKHVRKWKIQFSFDLVLFIPWYFYSFILFVQSFQRKHGRELIATSLMVLLIFLILVQIRSNTIDFTEVKLILHKREMRVRPMKYKVSFKQDICYKSPIIHVVPCSAILYLLGSPPPTTACLTIVKKLSRLTWVPERLGGSWQSDKMKSNESWKISPSRWW